MQKLKLSLADKKLWLLTDFHPLLSIGYCSSSNICVIIRHYISNFTYPMMPLVYGYAGSHQGGMRMCPPSTSCWPGDSDLVPPKLLSLFLLVLNIFNHGQWTVSTKDQRWKLNFWLNLDWGSIRFLKKMSVRWHPFSQLLGALGHPVIVIFWWTTCSTRSFLSLISKVYTKTRHWIQAKHNSK